jgi:hypothetical protein
MLINLGLPLMPSLLRLFFSLFGPRGDFRWPEIFPLAEILFFSIFVCIANLNINMGGKKGICESYLCFFFWLILISDVFALGMIYSGQVGVNMFSYSIIASIFPAVIAPIYKPKLCAKRINYKRKMPPAIVE